MLVDCYCWLGCILGFVCLVFDCLNDCSFLCWGFTFLWYLWFMCLWFVLYKQQVGEFCEWIDFDLFVFVCLILWVYCLWLVICLLWTSCLGLLTIVVWFAVVWWFDLITWLMLVWMCLYFVCVFVVVITCLSLLLRLLL